MLFFRHEPIRFTRGLPGLKPDVATPTYSAAGRRTFRTTVQHPAHSRRRAGGETCGRSTRVNEPHLRISVQQEVALINSNGAPSSSRATAAACSSFMKKKKPSDKQTGCERCVQIISVSEEYFLNTVFCSGTQWELNPGLLHASYPLRPQ